MVDRRRNRGGGFGDAFFLYEVWICFAAFIIDSCAATRPTSSSPDVAALIALKEGMVDPLGFLSSWNASDKTPCSWAGVLCNPDKLTVHTLNLTARGLSGSLSPSIGNLSGLVRLDVALNELSGELPPELGNCLRLEYLDVGSNVFSGSIPGELGNLGYLAYLSAHTNNLSGSIPGGIFQLRKLQEVYLNTNNLSGDISSTFQDEMPELLNLYLHENALSGTLPLALSKCRNLTAIILMSNLFEGVIPPELGVLENLQYLYLSHNNLHGSIPASLGNCKYLSILDLSENSLTGTIPVELGNSSSLSVLFLHTNSLSGSIPASLGSLQALTQLDLSYNHITGGIPPELGECGNLQYIGLQNNPISGTIPVELGNLKSLQILWLQLNKLEGEIPREIGNMSSLTDLRLTSNNLTGRIPAELKKLVHLEQLFLDGNQLEGEIPHDFGKHNNFTALEFSANRFTGRIPGSLCSSGQLALLNMVDNSLEGSIDEIANCTTIQRLRLSQNLLNGSIPRVFGHNKGLYFLDLASNMFHGSIPPELGLCSNLSRVDVSNNRLSGAIPNDLCKFNELQFLNAASNMLNASIPGALANCHNMSFLDLSSNSLQGNLPQEIANLTVLQFLRLQKNRLTGEIPAFVSNLKQLLELQVGENRLEGPIPASIGELTDLSIALNLSWNALSGQIPAQLGNLAQLQNLDLSHNNLSGMLPQQLSRMASLVSANLSFNQLIGDLPRGPWSQFHASSFVGNLGLCISNTSSCSSSDRAGPSSRRRSKLSTGAILGIALGTAGAVLLFITGCILWHICSKKPLYTRKGRKLNSIKLFGDSRRILSLRDVNNAMTSLSDESIIGRGAHGVVYRVTTASGQVFAVKKLLRNSNDSDAYQSFEREIETAGKFRHRNLVKLLGYRSGPELNVIIYDYMANGSVSNALHRHGDRLSWEERCRIALGTAQGLSYLHHDCVPQVIHRDVKTSNILLDDDMEAKLTDFGIAKLIDQDIQSMSAIAGTYGYIAPEYCYTMRVSEKIDVYAFGVVLLELLTRKSPYDPGFSEGMDLVSWVRTELQSTGSVKTLVDGMLLEEAENEEIMQLLRIALLCTAAEPKERPSMRQAVQLLEQIQPKKPEDHKKL